MANERIQETVSAFLRICPSGTKGDGLFTLRSFNKGCIICTAIGEIQNFPTFTSIQIDEHQHFEPIGILEDGTNNAVARLNHSCDPNSYVEYDRLNEFLLVKALKAISVDDELTIDYRKTEAKMVRPFNCNCGALNCGKYISGNENIKW